MAFTRYQSEQPILGKHLNMVFEILEGRGPVIHPSVPTSLSAIWAVDGSIVLTWAPPPANEGVSTFNIRYRKSSDYIYAMTVVPADFTTVKIYTLADTATYVFSIRAVDGQGYASDWSSEA